MAAALTLGKSAIVAGGASLGRQVMCECRRRPGVGAMTGAAVLLARNMICAFTLRDASVVACTATPLHGTVIDKRHCGPVVGGMTAGAGIGSRDMVRRLAGSRMAIVTALAISHHLGMVDVSHDIPTRRAVTSAALRGGSDVVRRFP